MSYIDLLEVLELVLLHTIFLPNLGGYVILFSYNFPFPFPKCILSGNMVKSIKSTFLVAFYNITCS